MSKELSDERISGRKVRMLGVPLFLLYIAGRLTQLCHPECFWA
jgi:hypothetical protein